MLHAALNPAGRKCQRPAWYASSVAPALIAWPAMLIPLRLAAPLLVAGFIAHYLQDRRLASQATLPAWYLPLRLRLSMVACACLPDRRRPCFARLNRSTVHDCRSGIAAATSPRLAGAHHR